MLKEEYLELVHSLKLLQVRDQACSVLQGLEELYLELHHFMEVPKQHVQLDRGGTKCFNREAGCLRLPVLTNYEREVCVVPRPV